MVKVFSSHISGMDRVLLRRYANHVLHRFVKPNMLRKSIITIKVIKAHELADKADYDDFKEAKAWVLYEGIENDKKKFTVIMNAARYNRRAKASWVRLKNLMIDVGHEMVHIKQYLNNELFDYADGKARFKGEVFHTGHSDDWESYFNSPWEIEAYGREYGLYKMFIKLLKEEQKAKKKKNKK